VIGRVRPLPLIHRSQALLHKRVLESHLIGPFVDLSIVNELDVIEQNPALLVKHSDYFRDLFARWAPLTSPKVADEIQRLMGPRE